MSRKPLTIRHMTAQEADLALCWAAAEGWNPGICDAHCFWNTDPQGFFIGLIDDLPVGCISAVRYGADYGFVGLYIVKPQWRGQGYGMQLWMSAMERLAGRTIGLDGVLAQQENYRKSGFQLSYRNIRYSGTFTVMAASDAAGSRAASCVVPICGIDRADLVAYDSSLFFAARPAFLPSWLNQPTATALAVVGNDGLMGYGVIRRCRNGFKLGPLFAENAGVAEQLLLSLTAYAKGEPVFLDVPEVNAAAVALATKYKMTRVFETARMYKGSAPAVALDKVFGVTTFELG